MAVDVNRCSIRLAKPVGSVYACRHLKIVKTVARRAKSAASIGAGSRARTELNSLCYLLSNEEWVLIVGRSLFPLSIRCKGEWGVGGLSTCGGLITIPPASFEIWWMRHWS